MSLAKSAVNAVPTSGDSGVVVACVAASTLMTVIAQISGKNTKASIRPVVGGFVVGTLLLGVGLWSPDVAKAFAVVLLATTAVTQGAAVFGVVATTTKGKS